MSEAMLRNPPRFRRISGFTLIELMVVMVIIGILLAIAVPSYRDYLIRSRIVEATSGLADLRVRMEQYYADNRNYAVAAVCGNDGTQKVIFPAATATRYFNFLTAGAPNCVVAADLVTGIAAQTYTITAVGKNNMAGFSYTINEQNTKTSTIVASAPANWIGTSTTCWLTSQGGTC